MEVTALMGKFIGITCHNQVKLLHYENNFYDDTFWQEYAVKSTGNTLRE